MIKHLQNISIKGYIVMKKMSAVLLTLLMLASLTACSEKQTENNALTANNTQTVSESKPEETAKLEEVTKTENAANSANSNEAAKPDESDKLLISANPEETNNPVYAGKHMLPLSDYPDGSYFTVDGKPCESHADCYWDGSCNCKVFDGSIQAFGFARYAYHEVHGKYLTEKTAVDKDITAESAKEMFSSLREGAYIGVHTANDYRHGLVVISADDKGITVYQANYGGKCVVTTPTYSWAEFARRFPHVYDYAV